MWPIGRPPKWVDRSQELATLRAGIEALRHGWGAAVWGEDEPGIGKSSLVAEALAGASELGWDIGWGIADQLAERLPLSVMQDCLQVRLSSPDPRPTLAGRTPPARAAAASLRCQGLPEADPVPLRDAVAHYRTIGPAAELPAAVENLAATLATPHTCLTSMRSRMPQTLVRLDKTGRAGPAAQLTESEARVLRYLPTHLTAPEIANELFLSVNTVSTHTRHLYAKLGAHSRHEAVDRARALGLLAPSARRA